MLRLSDFDYTLPKELIAQYPLEERDAARLLVLRRKDGLIEHRIFKEITGYLRQDDLLVLNNTRVLPCRLCGRRLSGGRVEALLLNHNGGMAFTSLIKPGRVKVGEKLIFNGGHTAGTVTSRNEITFSCPDIDSVYKLGVMPLPPYIKRDPEELDKDYYQTVYASKEGAVAAPTAGLHFTEGLLKKIRALKVEIAELTLHVGYGTFRPVKCEDVTAHKMEKEYFEISREAINLLAEARQKKGRVFAVGTTSCRALEAYASGESKGYTDLFIYPGYKFRMVDGFLTNFHLPRTTLFMLVCAFAGEKLIKKAYQEAVDKKYRFYSYGDAMLII
ncbi:MAG: tRNA preQ1(34) S-adenosylmethionine ribosyltransferase-isomerase QueA [Candidatus Omnitrophica bacterium]|nr:tRNA preQ1(34) S-adenosylmethionine ribosyltransferase-isomerase QueA [Candidatus Omnitrophota bacterium]